MILKHFNQKLVTVLSDLFTISTGILLEQHKNADVWLGLDTIFENSTTWWPISKKKQNFHWWILVDPNSGSSYWEGSTWLAESGIYAGWPWLVTIGCQQNQIFWTLFCYWDHCAAVQFRPLHGTMPVHNGRFWQPFLLSCCVVMLAA